MNTLKNTLFSKNNRTRTVSFLIVIIAFILLRSLSAAGVLSRLIKSLLVPVCCYIVAAIGLNLNIGISGELNLGQAGFMSVGGFTAAILAACLEGTAAPLRLAICIIAGAAAAGLIGWLISIPVLKLQGDYLAIVTLAFGQIIMSVFNNLYAGIDADGGLHFAFINNTLDLSDGGRTIIGGPMGASGIQTISTFPAGFVLILLSLFIVYNLICSKSGRAVMACRDNRIAAETIGINVGRTKTLAFVISSALGGMAGALYMLNYSSVTATKFDFNLSIMILVYVVLGGLGSITGTIISTTILVLLPELLRFLSGYRMLLYAVILILIMLLTNNEKLRVFIRKMQLRLRKKPAADAAAPKAPDAPSSVDTGKEESR